MPRRLGGFSTRSWVSWRQRVVFKNWEVSNSDPDSSFSSQKGASSTLGPWERAGAQELGQDSNAAKPHFSPPLGHCSHLLYVSAFKVRPLNDTAVGHRLLHPGVPQGAVHSALLHKAPRVPQAAWVKRAPIDSIQLKSPLTSRVAGSVSVCQGGAGGGYFQAILQPQNKSPGWGCQGQECRLHNCRRQL